MTSTDHLQRDKELLEAIQHGRAAEACFDVVLPVLADFKIRLIKRMETDHLDGTVLTRINCELKVIAELAAALDTAIQNGTAAQAEMVERSEPGTERTFKRRYNL
jgi:hypothetical protein